MLQLPSNYNFEIPKTIWKIKSCGAKRGTLQCDFRFDLCFSFSFPVIFRFSFRHFFVLVLPIIF